VTAATIDAVPQPKLNQPKRGLIAAGEVVLIVLLAFTAHWCWTKGVVRLEYPVDGHDPLVATRYLGNWIGGAVGLVTLAGVLLLDALRQTVLAVRTRGRKPAKEKDVAQATEEHV
jgi:hypothetical protein